jgi:phosphate transport system protein
MSGGSGGAGYIDHDRAIANLKQHVAEMSTLAVSMVADGTIAMLDSDRARMESVIAKDPQLDTYDIDIETETIRLIARFQPEGGDLRTLGAVLKIANCIDRVGRLGYDLARNLRDSPPIPDPTPVALLREMDSRTRAMVDQAVDAFVRGDADAEKGIFALDDDVDNLHHELQSRLIELLKGGGLSTERLALALLAGRHLERVGDNACKIAEKAVYAITGERRPEYFPRLAHRRTWGSEPAAPP